uniref:Mediator of RNA polymerase II transcription subunit 11 n=1 Tax=Aquila chrysaetos chrysaetos TaxID=223781 RepID=A0A663F515_AQUCH
MAGYGVANERLRVLEELEREIGASLQSAGTVILELSKEKAGERLLERQAAQFSAAVQKVESELSAQIRYPHPGGHGATPRGLQLLGPQSLSDGAEPGGLRPAEAGGAGAGLRADAGALTGGGGGSGGNNTDADPARVAAASRRSHAGHGTCQNKGKTRWPSGAGQAG